MLLYRHYLQILQVPIALPIVVRLFDRFALLHHMNKSRNRFRELKCIGVSSDVNQIAELDLFEEQDKREMSRLAAINFLNNIDSIQINGAQLIISKAFDSIGFYIVKDNIFKSLVITRLCEPSSKAATADYLR